MIDHFTKCSEEEEEPKRACYSLIKSTKEIRTPQQEKARKIHEDMNELIGTTKTVSFNHVCKKLRTKTTEGQYSPVRLELARLVSSLLYGFLINFCFVFASP